MNQATITLTCSVLHIITGLADGGAEAVLYRLCTHEDTHRHTVVSLMDAGKYGPLLEEAGVRVHCLGMPRGRLTWQGLRRLWRILRMERPDVVQTWMYHADLLGGVMARLAGVWRIFWGIHNSDLDPRRSPAATRLIARLCGLLSPVVPAAIVCCAQRARDEHVRLGYAAHKFVIIPNGYDVSRFRPDPVARAKLRQEWCVPDEVPLLGMVARFDPQKDHANLIRALGQLKKSGESFRCVLVGRGMDEGNAAIRSLLAAEGLEEYVHLLGPRNDIPSVMAALDVHVLSSAYGEAFPNVLAEAMACGTPCVTTDVGDAALIVGETGWVVPAANPAALARTIAMALDEWRERPAAWTERQESARKRIAEVFGLERMVQAYRRIWAGTSTKKRDE